MDVRNFGLPLPKHGPQNRLFWVVLQRHRDLSISIFGTKQAIDKLKKGLITKGPYMMPKFVKVWPANDQFS